MKTAILKKPLTLSISTLALAAMLSLSTAHAATLNAQLDRSKINTGDTVTLSIELPPNSSAQPDLSPLQQNFDILGTGSSTRMQIINGQTSQSNRLNITLLPHDQGKLTIPALKVGSDETTPLQLSVQNAPLADSSQAGSPVWVEMETGLPKDNHDVSVQQEIPVTVRLYSSIPLRNVSLNPPAPSGATVEKLTQDTQYQTERNGQTYQVVEQHYAVFPEQAGDLTIPPVNLRATTPDPNQQQRGAFGGGMFNDDFFQNAFKNSPLTQQMMNDSFSSDPFGMFDSGKPVNLRSNRLEFSVAHIPEAAQGNSWLPARNVTLSDSWQGNPPPLRSGEPANLTLTVTADGLTGAQIPAVKLPEIPGVRVYSEPAQTDNRTNGEQVIGTSTQTFTLIPEQTGQLALPAISLPWWNTRTQSMQTAELPAQTLTVAKGSGVSTPAPASGASAASTSTPSNAMTPTSTQTANTSAASANTSQLTQPDKEIIGVLLLLLLLGGGWYWYRRLNRNSDSGKPSATSAAAWTPTELRTAEPATASPATAVKRAELDAAQENFEQACATNDPYLSAQTLLEWAKLVWPQKPPVSLPELAGKVDGDAQTEIDKLHQRLYQPDKQEGEWSGDALASALRPGLRSAASRKGKYADKPDDQGLPPLYPA